MWQPIETAPKDGTRFIARTKANLVFVAYNQKYYDKWPHEDGGPTFNEHLTIDKGDATFPVSYLTHWMPLVDPNLQI